MAEEYPTYLQFGHMSKISQFFSESSPNSIFNWTYKLELSLVKILELVATNTIASWPPNGDWFKHQPLLPNILG